MREVEKVNDKIAVIRGATTVNSDTVKDICESVTELVGKLVSENCLNTEDNKPIFCIISSTADITAYYPARAVRESGILDCPLFSCLEPPIKGSLPMCVRVMVEAVGLDSARHVYLRGAKVLRPDLCGTFAVAIDGPSGAGKSTIAKLLAKSLNMTYLDTGAMYRAIGLKMHNSGISISDEAGINRILCDTDISVEYKDGVQKVYLDGKDVGEEIRKHYVSKLASDFSAIESVRKKLVEMQRKIASERDCILDGRDIGTKVLPNAPVKFFLTASTEVRAKRRYDELTAKGEKCDFVTVKKDIESRDYNDSHRKVDPLKRAADAIEIDSSDMSVEQVVAKMTEEIERKRGERK